MSDRYFLDTNIVLYAFDKNAHKKQIALRLLKSNPVISWQVLNEATNILLKKFNLAKKSAWGFLDDSLH